MIKRIASSLLAKIGIRISRAPIIVKGLKIEYNFFARHQWLSNYNFETILDIGANKGQFAARMRLLFPKAKIYSFEPIPEVFNELCLKFKDDKDFKAFNIGLGQESGTFDFFQNDFSDSSSLLPMKDFHKDTFPQTLNEKKIQIKVETLDSVASTLQLDSPILIKIDVQGFEKMVILGGKETIKKAKLIIIEVSFFGLYENQVFFGSVYSELISLGFEYQGNYEQMSSPIDGCVLQADAIFRNSKL